MRRKKTADRRAPGHPGWGTSQALAPVALREDDRAGSGDHNSAAWPDSALYSDASQGRYFAPPWSPDRPTQLKSRPLRQWPVPLLARLALVLVNLAGLACVGYALTILVPRISDAGAEVDERVGLTAAAEIVVSFAALGLVTHVTTFAWRWARRRRFPRRVPSAAPSFGTIFIVWAGIAALLAVVGSTQLADRGSTRLPNLTGSSSPSSSDAQESMIDRRTWSGSVRDGANGRVGGLLMTVEDNTVTSLTMAIDSEGCPKALDLRQPTQIDSSSLRIPIGRQRDEALLKGTFKDKRFEGRISIGACRLDARVVASPRVE